jgi:hypothetical protein
MSGIFRNMSGRSRPATGHPLPQSTELALQSALREERRVKDALAGLAETWRRRGAEGDRYARELEAQMGWELPGDPLTGCRPVTPGGPATG